MKWRWVELREGNTKNGEMRPSDEKRKGNSRWSRGIELGQAGSMTGVGEDESRGSRCWGRLVNHSMMDHDVSR